MSEGTQRRLAAILAADVVGYSRLMSEDETGTLDALRYLRREVFAPAVSDCNGTLVKSMGDGWLVEFPSVADGVGCAIRVQEVLAEHERIIIRIGLHVGDVTFEDEDIYGDGVNVASRLQELADPGAIVISGAARSGIDRTLAAGFVDLGAHNLKNIAEPVTAFGWGMDKVRGMTTSGTVSDRPSIAVLPFDNMGGDPEQEYFADGITEDIITVLSRFRTFSVCARNSTFAYKGTPIDIKQLAQDLGIQYVVEGSVRKGGNRVRITAQLIDAESDSHVWAERYDRELEDIFAVQDEITESIVAAVAPELVSAEIQRAQQKDRQELGIWDAIMRARWHLMRFSAEDNAETKQLLEFATNEDPTNVVAWSDLAWSHLFDFSFGWSGSPPASLEQASIAAKNAISLDRNDGRAQTAQGIVSLFSGEHDDAIDSLKKAIDLNQNEPLAHGYLGLALAFGGDGRAAIPQFENAMRLSPRDHFMIIWLIGSAWAAFAEEQFDLANDWLAKARRENPQFPDVYTLLAASHAHIGNADAAKDALAELMQLLPGLSLDDSRLVRPFRKDDDRIRLMEGLRLAGLL
jgi:adenylate cyclase